MCQHTKSYDDCPECRELIELRSRVAELEANDRVFRAVLAGFIDRGGIPSWILDLTR